MKRYGHSGVGPKGYSRNDEKILDEVSLSLMENPEVDAAEIEVQVSDGVVYLTGTVSDRYQKRMAEDCAEAVMGVKDVQNSLNISKKAPHLPKEIKEVNSLIKGLY